jgi:DNA helicase-2/ATP-dependent DNA helicase PcrA
VIDLTKLNKNQLAAVSAPTGSTLVVAGAGTGKTRVLTLRFAYLVTTLNYDQTKILAITFTNRAAEEMKLRITDVLNKVYLP